MKFQTEFEFELPKGYVDSNGEVHKKGVMRLATAADEILPLKDPKVQLNPGYLSVMLLSRVITKLGTLPEVNAQIVENMFTADIAYLERMYQVLNAVEPIKASVVCPKCEQRVQVEIPFLGES